jgi:hypothetical protein
MTTDSAESVGYPEHGNSKLLRYRQQFLLSKSSALKMAIAGLIERLFHLQYTGSMLHLKSSTLKMEVEGFPETF